MKISVKLSLLRIENPNIQKENTIIFKYKFRKYVFVKKFCWKYYEYRLLYTNCILLLDLKIVSQKFCIEMQYLRNENENKTEKWKC